MLEGRPYFPAVVTGRTEARDLMWRFDAIQRLADAQAWRGETQGRDPAKLETYVRPGVLWWGFAPGDAKEFGKGGNTPPVGSYLPDKDTTKGPVVLLDEIDKADPDLPNNLLAPLSYFSFQIDELDGRTVKFAASPNVEQRPLIFITTNRERDLPVAFVRRCVVLDLTAPKTVEDYVRIAKKHFPEENWPVCRLVAENVVKIESTKDVNSQPRRPSTAEYLDAVRICLSLQQETQSPEDLIAQIWKEVVPAVLTKREPGEASAEDKDA